MGKRKSAKKPQAPKRRDPLSTTFSCLFCNHENSVVVKLDRKAGAGRLECKVCGRDFMCNINALSAPVDVYSEWVDACDAVAKGRGSAVGGGGGGGGGGGRAREEEGAEEEEW